VPFPPASGEAKLVSSIPSGLLTWAASQITPCGGTGLSRGRGKRGPSGRVIRRKCRPGTGSPGSCPGVLAQLEGAEKSWGEDLGPGRSPQLPARKGRVHHHVAGRGGPEGAQRPSLTPRGKEGDWPRQSPAERFLGSGFSFRGVQPVTSRRSLTARGFPLTVKAVGLAGVFLSY